MLMALCLFAACRKPEIGNHEGGDNDTITIIEDTIVNPYLVVTTTPPVDITATEATCGAKVTSSGCDLKELGICWGTAAEPTVSDSVRKTDNCTEPFT